MSILFSQIKIVSQSTKSRIAEALKNVLLGMPQLKYVAFDRVRLYTSDFRENEIPAAQFIDVAEQITHERNRVLRTWTISLEVIHKSTENEYVSQQDMWNLNIKFPEEYGQTLTFRFLASFIAAMFQIQLTCI